MRRLRQKLEVDANNPHYLMTVRGVGYKLVTDETRTSDEPARARGRCAGGRRGRRRRRTGRLRP